MQGDFECVRDNITSIINELETGSLFIVHAKDSVSDLLLDIV